MMFLFDLVFANNPASMDNVNRQTQIINQLKAPWSRLCTDSKIGDIIWILPVSHVPGLVCNK